MGSQQQESIGAKTVFSSDIADCLHRIAKMASEKFCLRWNDFETNISTAFRELRDDKDFFDVTLACNGDQIQAHKVILSACSPFFRNILRRNPHQHPLLYLKGVKYSDLQSVLNFMYHGEVNVAQDELNSFLAVAEELRVKGLTQNNQSGSSTTNSSGASKSGGGGRPASPKSPTPKTPRSGSDSSGVAPPAKRARPNNNPPSSVATSYGGGPADDDDDIQEVVPVKSEPRDTSSANTMVADPYATGGGGGGAGVTASGGVGTALAPTNHQLQTEEDATYDESYDDYGQYDQSYDSSMIDPNMTGDSNKGPPVYLEDFVNITTDSPKRFSCTVCGKSFGMKHHVENHLESQHFPYSNEYTCAQCGKLFNTKHKLQRHMSFHKT